MSVKDSMVELQTNKQMSLGGGLSPPDDINMLMASCPHTVRSELALLLLIRPFLPCAPLKQCLNYREAAVSAKYDATLRTHAPGLPR